LSNFFAPSAPAPSDVLAGWLASATPAPRLAAGLPTRASRSEAIGQWLFSAGDLSVRSAFMAEHPAWSDNDWMRARDELWQICTSLDFGLGAPQTLALIEAAYERAEKTLLPQGQELLFWRAVVEDGVSQKNLLAIEGAFSKQGIDRAVDRAPLPPFVGELDVEARRSLFANHVILALNGAAPLRNEIARPGSARASFAPVWKINAKLMGGFDARQEMAHDLMPGSDALAFSFISVIEPRGKGFSFERLQAQAKTDIERARDIFRGVLGPLEPLPVIFSALDLPGAPAAAGAIREWTFNCVSAERKAEIFAEFEREALRQAIRQAPRLPDAQGARRAPPVGRRI